MEHLGSLINFLVRFWLIFSKLKFFQSDAHVFKLRLDRLKHLKLPTLLCNTPFSLHQTWCCFLERALSKAWIFRILFFLSNFCNLWWLSSFFLHFCFHLLEKFFLHRSLYLDFTILLIDKLSFHQTGNHVLILKPNLNLFRASISSDWIFRILLMLWFKYFKD